MHKKRSEFKRNRGRERIACRSGLRSRPFDFSGGITKTIQPLVATVAETRTNKSRWAIPPRVRT